MKTLIFTAFLTLTSLSFAATEQEKERLAIDNLEKAAKTLSKADLSCKTDRDCQVLELGSRACGGASDFLIASKKNHNYSSIEFLANQSVNSEESYNQKYRIISICSMADRPETACINKKCVETDVSAF